MKSEDKVVNLFCIYTTLSIAISILAWAAVGLNLVSISPTYTSGIGPAGWLLAGLAYVLGLFVVYRLGRQSKFNFAAFGVYPAVQALTLAHAYTSNGWLFAPSAGSQGTIPALLISLAMLVYLFSKNHQSQKLA